ncbi:MAG: metallophosphoesterase family protein [Desulfobacterales bacterium]|nr:metallophosphoesterase family protein [Desulfobacterales bacterium]
MRIAVISDIHGNMEAFRQVLDDIGRSNVDGIFCLGDMVGYGPEPEAVVQQIQALEIPTVMGNHELGVANTKVLKYFNPLARRSLQQTAQMLSDNSIRYIRSLEAAKVLKNCRLVHGFPPDSISTYLFQITDDKIISTFKVLPEPICFVGHTHVIEMISFDGRVVMHEALSQGVVRLKAEQRQIINVGSVGQPRDDNNNAKYIIWDNKSHEIEVRYIPYDIEAVANKIIAAGLPKSHAYRLR